MRLRSRVDGQQNITCISENALLENVALGVPPSGPTEISSLNQIDLCSFPGISRSWRPAGSPTTQQEKNPKFTISAGRQIPKQSRRKQGRERGLVHHDGEFGPGYNMGVNQSPLSTRAVGSSEGSDLASDVA